MGKTKVLKEAAYKSFEWANDPVIGPSMFREYDLRNATIPLSKGGKEVKAEINVEGFRALGQAYGTFVLENLSSKKVVISGDYRSYGNAMKFAFITGVISTGCDVIDIGTSLTPVLYFAQYEHDCEAGAMITASHNDNGWSGVKLAKGLSKTFEKDDIVKFKESVYNGEFKQGAGTYTRDDSIQDKYIQDIIKQVQPFQGQKKLKVVVSSGNGGGGRFLPEVIKGLGHDVIELNCEMDWDFPHFNPNPENIKFLHSMADTVTSNNADLGVACDGDGDRFGIVNEKGEEIFSDRAGLCLARYFAQTSNKPGTIVIDVKCTGAFAKDDVLSEAGCDIKFSSTGHSYVKALSNELDAMAGFERSGHFFCRHEFGRGYDDASLASAWFCAVLSNDDDPLSTIIARQPKSYQSPTMQPSVTDDVVKYDIVEDTQKKLIDMQKSGTEFSGKKIADVITVNGSRINFEDGSWGLIRASSNQAVLVMGAESFDSRRRMYDIIEALQALLAEYPDVGKYDQELPPYPGED